MAVLEDLTEEEAYLYAILSDESGLDICEFCWYDAEQPDGCFRAWPFQWKWWRSVYQQQIDQAARSVGKSLSIQVRAFAFPFLHPGQEMVITAPEGNHLDAITDNVETKFMNTRLGREMLVAGRSGVKHRPFHMNFANGSRIMGRIPQRDGKGVKGCRKFDSPVLTKAGYKPAQDITTDDYVLNGDLRWVKVSRVIHDINDCYRVEGAGSFEEEVSCDHRFLGVTNEASCKEKRQFSQWVYHDVEFLLEDQFYWATPTKFPHVDPVYPGDSSQSKTYNYASEEFWWLAGLYAADGYVRGNGRRLAAVNWVSHPKNKGRKKLIRALNRLDCNFRITKRQWSSADQIEVSSHHFATWCAEQIGRKSHLKTLPAFVLSLPEEFKLALLDGYLAGDGHYNEVKNRWECSSASKSLMMMVQLLAQSVGLQVMAHSVQPTEKSINGTALKKEPFRSWRLHISLSGHSHKVDDYLVGKVKKVTSIGKHPIVNIQVEDGRSYLGGTIMNHNIHPIWLELDEAQDYPDAGWTEIIETLKMGSVGAVWRAHGVTRGQRDYFYKFTQPDSGWKVHRLCLPSSALVYGEAGPVRIEDIEEGTSVFGCAPGPTLQVSEVTGKTDNGVQPTWKITTRDREITSTFNHPVLAVTNDQTRKTRRKLEFEWREASDVKPGDFIVIFTKAPSSDRIALDPQLRGGMEVHSPNRCVPSWIWTASDEAKHAFLNGYLIADGSLARQKRGQDALAISCASESLVRELVVLAQYLGYRTTKVRSHSSSTPLGESRTMWRAYIYQHAADFVQVPRDCSVHDPELDEHLAIRKVLTSEATGVSERTWDIEVGELHNFIADGVVVHNTAMHRPTWTDDERQKKIESYGSRDHPDYRRNVLGLHGDATNPLFVLHRLMQCVDSDNESDFNKNEYTFIKINNEMVLEYGDDILPMLDFPHNHERYQNFWIGMDVGYTNHPSEIVVFAETKERAKDVERGIRRPDMKRKTALKLLSRVRLERISHGHQVAAILWLINLYRPHAFAMDKTGLGLPLFQDIQERAAEHKELRSVVDTIKGYNFSGKILVDFDTSIELDEHRGDAIRDQGIERNVLEYSSDRLRAFVDDERIILPNSADIVREFQGQTWVYDKSTMDMYGRRKVFSKGSFHVLDAARMAVLGYVQHSIEEMTKVEKFEPVTEIFLSF